ncbi:hypothetical protein MMC16_003593 [Acarospora aff. strigata]|nr:hypothetical protein [Acarospora aff. strigata]
MHHRDTHQKLRVLVVSAGLPLPSLDNEIFRRLGAQPGLNIRSLAEVGAKGRFLLDDEVEFGSTSQPTFDQTEDEQGVIAHLNEWADLLVLAPLDTDTLAKMLNGISDNILLELLRSWDVSKKILLVPSMSTSTWENPMTRKQLSKIRRKWNWIKLLQPVLWHIHPDECKRKVAPWEGIDGLVEFVKNQADLMSLGQDMDSGTFTASRSTARDRPNLIKLPPEIWTIIYEYVGDWEVAKSLGVYTNLSTPTEWERPLIKDDLHVRMRGLEWAILTGSFEDVIKRLDSYPPPKWLSRLCVKLIIKFARTDLLSHLEKHHKDLFRATFGRTLLPTKASAVFGKTAILEWWRTSPSFHAEDYHADAIDGASKAGFVHVLDWWRHSGLPLRYTEASLEQASSRGNIAVLDWWKNASSVQHDGGGGYNIESDTMKYAASRARHQTPPSETAPASTATMSTATPTTTLHPLPLKVGKSITFASQNNQASTLTWWDTSGIPYTHEETVARIASSNGHVSVLSTWQSLKGSKMIFDNQVLVGATKNGHDHVLEWWKNSGFRVEYKTCDVEEALEDCIGGEDGGEGRVREWWGRNGLNLGVGTKEWMKVKVL